MARQFVAKLMKEENVAALKAGEKTLQDLAVNKMDMEAYIKAFEAKDNAVFASHAAFAKTALRMTPGEVRLCTAHVLIAHAILD